MLSKEDYKKVCVVFLLLGFFITVVCVRYAGFLVLPPLLPVFLAGFGLAKGDENEKD